MLLIFLFRSVRTEKKRRPADHETSKPPYVSSSYVCVHLHTPVFYATNLRILYDEYMRLTFFITTYSTTQFVFDVTVNDALVEPSQGSSTLAGVTLSVASPAASVIVQVLV